MNRAVGLVLGAVAAAVVTAAVVHRLRVAESPDAWLGRQLGLEGEALAAFTAAHARYEPVCAENCRRLGEATRALADAVAASREVTPEIARAIAATDAVHSACRTGMLKHFYEVAAMLEEPRRSAYLRQVLPMVIRGNMREGRVRP
jgi:hypothetical protein